MSSAQEDVFSDISDEFENKDDVTGKKRKYTKRHKVDKRFRNEEPKSFSITANMFVSMMMTIAEEIPFEQINKPVDEVMKLVEPYFNYLMATSSFNKQQYKDDRAHAQRDKEYWDLSEISEDDKKYMYTRIMQVLFVGLDLYKIPTNFCRGELKFLIAMHKQVLTMEDFNGTSSIRRPKKQGKNVAKFSPHVNSIASTLLSKTTDQIPIMMQDPENEYIMTLRANNISIFPIFDLASDIGFFLPEYNMISESTVQPNCVKLQYYDCKRIMVLVTPYITLYSVGDGWLIPRGNLSKIIDSEFPACLPLKMDLKQPFDYCVFDCTLQNKQIHIVDIVSSTCKDSHIDYPARRKIIEKTTILKPLSIISEDYTENHIQVHKDTGKVCLYQKPNYVVGVFGMRQRMLLVAMMNLQQELVYKWSIPAPHFNGILNIICRSKKIVNPDTNAEKYSILYNGKSYFINLPEGFKEFYLFNKIISCEFKEANKLGVVTEMPITLEDNYKPIVLKDNSKIDSVLDGFFSDKDAVCDRIQANPELLAYLLEKMKSTPDISKQICSEIS